MSDTFTVNKNIDQPSSGSYVNSWDVPVNSNWGIIDKCFGGTTSISVTGIVSNTALTISQYQPPNISFIGSLSASIEYYIPAGVGGIWSIGNFASGAFALSFGIASGNSIQLIPGTRTLIVSDGVSVAFASTNNNTSFSQILGTILNSQMTSGAVLQYQGSFSLAASQITSGTIANARLPNAASMPGVTIAADPGTTPSGPAGSIWYYY